MRMKPSEASLFNWRLIALSELRRLLTRDTGKLVFRHFMDIDSRPISYPNEQKYEAGNAAQRAA